MLRLCRLCRHELDPSHFGRTIEADWQHGDPNAAGAIDEVVSDPHQAGVARQLDARVCMPNDALRQAYLPAVRVAGKYEIKPFVAQGANDVGRVRQQQARGVLWRSRRRTLNVIEPVEGIVHANECEGLSVNSNVCMRVG